MRVASFSANLQLLVRSQVYTNSLIRKYALPFKTSTFQRCPASASSYSAVAHHHMKTDSMKNRSEMKDSTEAGDNQTTEELPKLTPAEFRVYNRLAEHMDYFHNHFRHSWDVLYKACCNNKRPSGVSIREFLNMGIQFLSQLGFHHSIEEQSIFPVLAKKMPEFKKEVHLLKQHKEIHKGMDRLEAYLEACRSGEKELRLDEMKQVMDSFGKVLWDHLDDEVKTLGAENMRKYWTPEEMKRLPM